MRVILCDPHLVFAEALAAMLRKRGCDAEVTTSPASALRAAAAGADVCVMDISFPGEDGVEGTRRILAAAPDVKIFVLTARTDPDAVRAAIDAGATGIASKQRGVRELIEAIERVADGETYCDPTLSEEPSENGGRYGERFLADFLTSRERQVLEYLVEGANTRRIARSMGITFATARTHVQAVLTKLGVHSRLEAAAFAVRNGIVPPRRERGA
ncbi:DNA-binding response regulator [Carbonactinospora thermoautotrophica]|uniref:Two component transcriptional regulator n=1 Tax=Carbonactinospora thermoautotrophica TaxID=1469144 RepID=A0A132MRP5_9ACTN|nr:response regulator transcription factor [Carbonactinospora thermoautotrophica]KWX00499.1 hypothetical protein TH66_17260 [Carbonactinospora thermoautotrophica]KWX01431.1 Two component transcriptional regulator [Carbonactinospora thermoautotrophica]KWX07480.1 hypothetical protein TR74_18660 [Carbonactinospora thermoautotrophica]MCX9192878.1 DNA-binding response regulator [Carbonactinospora thermoautotrophica]